MNLTDELIENSIGNKKKILDYPRDLIREYKKLFGIDIYSI